MTRSELKRKIVKYLPLSYRKFENAEGLNLGDLIDCPAGYHPTNPGVLEFEGNLLISIRLVNYLLISDQSTTSYFTSGDQYHSFYRFILIDSDGNLLRQLDHLDKFFEGREDIRLLKSANEIFAVYSENDNAAKIARIGYAKVDFSLNVMSSVTLESPFGFQQEKNWSPFIHEGNLRFIYSLQPLVILKPTGDGKVVPVNVPKLDGLKSLMKFPIKGSSPGVASDVGWTFIFHRRKTQLFSRKKQIYVSYFVTLDKDFQSYKVSRPFSIGEATVQFVCGLIMSPAQVIISYGRADREAVLLFTTVEKVRILMP